MIFNIICTDTSSKTLEFLTMSLNKLSNTVNVYNQPPQTYNSNFWIIINPDNIDALPKNCFVFLDRYVAHSNINNYYYLCSNKNLIKQYINAGVASLNIYYLPTDISTEYINTNFVWSQFEHFDWHFFRCLLSLDFISYEIFENVVSFPKFDSTVWLCVTIPESFERHEHFLDQNIKAFPLSTIKRNPGWKGYCLLTKFIFSKAAQNNLNYLVLVEDDIEIFSNFYQDVQHIQQYLSSIDNWDIFVGLMSQINGNITHVYNEFIHLDSMVSTVFNIYNKSMFDHVASWDVNTNSPWLQFDRWLGLKSNLQVITKIPFFINHASNLKSSIWSGYNGPIYDTMINTAQNELLKRKAAWIKK